MSGRYDVEVGTSRVRLSGNGRYIRMFWSRLYLPTLRLYLLPPKES
jgi:hypothetical protein